VLSLDIVGEPVRLGFLPGVVTLYAFTRDSAGNVSQAITPEPNGQGHDHARVDYEPGEPPEVRNFFVTNSANACPTFAPTDVTTAASNLYLRWNVDFVATQGTDPEEIRVEYTSDDVSYTPLTMGPLGNTGTTGCSVGPCGATGPTFTGCYTWPNTPPLDPAQYVRFRLKAQNKKGVVTVRSSVPALNVADKIRFIAGNPDPGIDGNATAAAFLTGAKQRYIAYARDTLAVNEWGVLFHLDPANGILWVNPDTGTVSRVAQTTGVATDGVVGSTGAPPTFASPQKIFMTHEDDVLVWDGPAIRRIVTDPASGVPTSVVTELTNPGGCTGASCLCNAVCSIVALPNGDYLFNSMYGFPGTGTAKFAIYRREKATGLVTSIVPSGIGYSAYANADISTCYLSDMHASYDPVTGNVHQLHAGVSQSFGQCAPTGGIVTMDPNGVSVTTSNPAAPHAPSWASANGFFAFTGLDGYLYEYADNGLHGGMRYDDATNTIHPILNTWVSVGGGTCPTYVHPKNCNPEPNWMFVDKAGAVFWSSFGKIRSIDVGDDGPDGYTGGTDVSGMNDKVVDVFGQGLDFGLDDDALSARIAFSSALSVWNDGTDEQIPYVDNINLQLRQATVGKTVTLRAGNGVNTWPVLDALGAQDEPYYTHSESSFQQDPSGRIYGQFSTHLAYSDGPTDPWHTFAGGGATAYSAAPDQSADFGPGSAINFAYPFYAAWPFGVTASRILFSFVGWDGSAYVNGMVKSYAKSDGSQRHISGVTGPISSNCVDGTLRNACVLNMHYYAWDRTHAVYDAPRARWVWRSSLGGNHFYSFDDDGVGGPAGALKGAIGPTHSGAFSAWTYRYESGDAFYVCLTNGHLARATHDATTWTFTELAWPIASLTCSGQDLVWTTDDKRILFAYKQFGLGGIAAYVIDP
jgi:hypothetical protein